MTGPVLDKVLCQIYMFTLLCVVWPRFSLVTHLETTSYLPDDDLSGVDKRHLQVSNLSTSLGRLCNWDSELRSAPAHRKHNRLSEICMTATLIIRQVSSAIYAWSCKPRPLL